MDPSPSASQIRAQRIQGTPAPAPAALEPEVASVSLRGFLAAGGVALAGAALFGGWFASRRPDPAFGLAPDRPREFGDFQLTERSGRAVHRTELDGKICVVSFVFTSCGFTCREVSRNLARLQTLLAGPTDDVRLVSLTVDPRTDTPPVLAKFAARFDADPARWLFLTGDSVALETLIETSFLPKSPLANGDPMPGNFLGTGRVVLVDGRGQVRGYFDGLNRSTPEALHQAILRLRAERPTS